MEADIIFEDQKLNKKPIDLICVNKVYNFIESKFTISPNIDAIKLKISELRNIILKVKKGKEFLSTLDFKVKKKITEELDNCIPIERIYSSEDIFGIRPIDE